MSVRRRAGCRRDDGTTFSWAVVLLVFYSGVRVGEALEWHLRGRGGEALSRLQRLANLAIGTAMLLFALYLLAEPPRAIAVPITVAVLLLGAFGHYAELFAARPDPHEG